MTATAAARTVRIDGSADGVVGVELSGTTFSADLDLESGDTRSTFFLPAVRLTGEVIIVDGTTYLKSTLTGPLYRTLASHRDVPEPSRAIRATILEELARLLARPELDPVKAEDVPCGNATCYRVEISLSPADLAALGAGELEAPTDLPIPVPLPDLSAATFDLTVLVAQDTTRLAGITADTDLGASGTAAVELTFSKWDEAVTISPPSPDQVEPSR